MKMCTLHGTKVPIAVVRLNRVLDKWMSAAQNVSSNFISIRIMCSMKHYFNVILYENPFSF